MRVGKCLLLVSLAVAAVGCGPRVRGEWDGFAQPQVLQAAGLQYYWHVDVGLEKKEKIDRLFLLGNDLYCLTDKNRMLAIDATRGIWRWTQRVASPRQRVFAPIAAKAVALPNWIGDAASTRPTKEMIRSAQPFDAVILNTLTDILVMDRTTGNFVVRIRLDFPTNTGGAFAVDAQGVPVYCVVSASGTCYGIDLRTGLSIWRVPSGAVDTAPVLHDGILYVASGAGTLTATFVADGPRPLWRSTDIDSREMHAPVTAAFYVDDRGCFVPCQDNRLYAYDRLNGRPLWPAVVCQGPLRTAVQVGLNTVFQRADWDKFYAVDLVNGSIRWTLPAGRMVLAVMQEKGNRVHLLDEANNLRIVEEATGEEIASLPMTGYQVYLPNARAPVIYAASRAGRIACIRPESAEPLTPEMLSR